MTASKFNFNLFSRSGPGCFCDPGRQEARNSTWIPPTDGMPTSLKTHNLVSHHQLNPATVRITPCGQIIQEEGQRKARFVGKELLVHTLALGRNCSKTGRYVRWAQSAPEQKLLDVSRMGMYVTFPIQCIVLALLIPVLRNAK